MSHIFVSPFVLLVPRQWQSRKRTTALPAAVMLQLTTPSGLWLLSLPPDVLFSLFLLPTLGSAYRGVQRLPPWQSPHFLFCETDNISSKDLHKNKASPFSEFQTELLKISSYFLFILLFSAESICLQLPIPKLNVCPSLLWRKHFFCLHSYIHKM